MVYESIRRSSPLFVTDRLIYLQMQKTACSHIASMLARTVGGKQIGLHNRLPRRYSSTDKYVVGSIRNPWDWYVSQWSYGCSGHGGLQKRLSRRRLGRIFETPVNEVRKPVGLWREAYRDFRDPECFRKWLKMMFDPRRIKDLGEGYARSSISEFAGLMTFRYIKIHTKNLSHAERRGGISDLAGLKQFDADNNVLDAIIQVESLEDDLVRVLREAGHALGEDKLCLICSGAENKVNPSEHRASGFYYDEETDTLVTEYEKFIIEKYGYSLAYCNGRDGGDTMNHSILQPHST